LFYRRKEVDEEEEKNEKEKKKRAITIRMQITRKIKV